MLTSWELGRAASGRVFSHHTPWLYQWLSFVVLEATPLTWGCIVHRKADEAIRRVLWPGHVRRHYSLAPSSWPCHVNTGQQFCAWCLLKKSNPAARLLDIKWAADPCLTQDLSFGLHLPQPLILRRSAFPSNRWDHTFPATRNSIPLKLIMKILAVISLLITMAYAVDLPTGTRTYTCTDGKEKLLHTQLPAVHWHVTASRVKHWTFPSIIDGANRGEMHIKAGTTGKPYNPLWLIMQLQFDFLMLDNYIVGKQKYPHPFFNKEGVEIEPKCVGKTLSIFPLISPTPLVYTGGEPGVWRVILSRISNKVEWVWKTHQENTL